MWLISKRAKEIGERGERKTERERKREKEREKSRQTERSPKRLRWRRCNETSALRMTICLRSATPGNLP